MIFIMSLSLEIPASLSSSLLDSNWSSYDASQRFSQLRHLHPAEHIELFFTHLHCLVLQSKATLSRTISMFLGLYQRIASVLSSIDHPCLSRGRKVIVFIDDCLHMLITQHDLSQCSCSAQFDGIMTFSLIILGQIVCLILSSHCVWCSCTVAWLTLVWKKFVTSD